MVKEQKVLSALYELQEVEVGTDFSKSLNTLVVELENRIQKNLIPLI
jgi:hypothetical protein